MLAEFVRGRVCQGPSLLGAEMSRNRWVHHGGGGGIFFVFFQSSTYFTVNRGGSNGFITEKTILFQGSRGFPTFSTRGSIFFPGGVQMLITIEPI